MKRFIIIALCLSSILVKAQDRGCEYENVMFITSFYQCDDNPWTLVFRDEFNDDTLDLSKWEIQPWGQGGLYGNNGKNQEYNTLNNAIIRTGILNIVAKRDTITAKAIDWMDADAILEDGLPNLRPYYFTSSNIWTKFKFNHGKFEARIKIPKGKGFWPAFWTFTGDPWNEIDVFEFWNEKNIFDGFDPTKLAKVQHMTVHYDYDNDGSHHMCETNPENHGIDCSQDFHIYGMTWEEDNIQWFFDGNLIRTMFRRYSITGQEIGCNIYAYTYYIQDKIYPVDPMNIILNLAIQYGDNGQDSPNGSTIFPNQMQVDWVRYYQRNACTNISITNYNQHPLENELYNTIVGRNINTNCTYNIPSDYILSMIASESITIGPGFHSSQGSIFNAKIEPDLYGSSIRDSNMRNNYDTKNVLDSNMISYTDYYNDINLYPNPNNGNFIIDFGENSNNNGYDIYVTNMYGESVFKYDDCQTSLFTIDMTSNKQGVYIVYIYDKNHNIWVNKKIIIQ